MCASFKWKMAQKLELKWWKSYLNKKDVAQYLQWKRNYWTQFLSEVAESVSIQPNDTILDAGSGPAGIFIIMDNYEVTALDPLLENYEQELPHFSKSMYPKVQFETSSIEDFNPERTYDKVFCLNAINHVADIEKAYDQLFRFTKKGGLLIVSIDSHRFSLLKHLFRMIPGDALHPHQYDLQEYRKFITKRNGTILQEIKSKPGNIFDYWVMVVRKG
jgi:2-polyprenyl-6-hydroxyphenyl methylase/3-demethylubiquinone-9 3-methyltransferase